MTEIRVLDTYWSDHCRHTTFSTELKDVSFDDGYYRAPMEETYQDYLATHKNLYAGRFRQIRVPDGHCLNGDEAPQKGRQADGSGGIR